jgi:hypothetical protein
MLLTSLIREAVPTFREGSVMFPVPREPFWTIRTPASPGCRVDCEGAPMATSDADVNIALDFVRAAF